MVMQRLEQLCECVLKGKWPQVEKHEALLQSQLAVPSPSMVSFPGLMDLDMSALAPGVSLGEKNDYPSKAFKVERVGGLTCFVLERILQIDTCVKLSATIINYFHLETFSIVQAALYRLSARFSQMLR